MAVAVEGLISDRPVVWPEDDQVSQEGEAVAMADALAWWAAAVAPASVGARDRLGLQGRREGKRAGEVDWFELDPEAVRAQVGSARTVQVEVRLSLDPVLFGQLRQGALRDPSLIAALGQGEPARVVAAWRLTSDLRQAAGVVSGLFLGTERYAVAGEERGAWVEPFLAALAQRVGWVRPHAEARVAAALLSGDRATRARAVELAEAWAASPPNWPALQPWLGQGGPRLAFGPDLLPLRRLGPSAERWLAVLEAAFLLRPDVLVLEEPLSQQQLAWWAGLLERPGGPIEQSLVVAPAGSERP